MHSGPRWNRGSPRRLARIRLRGNWPDRWSSAVILLVLVAVGCILAAHSWIEHAWWHLP